LLLINRFEMNQFDDWSIHSWWFLKNRIYSCVCLEILCTSGAHRIEFFFFFLVLSSTRVYVNKVTDILFFICYKLFEGVFCVYVIVQKCVFFYVFLCKQHSIELETSDHFIQDIYIEEFKVSGVYDKWVYLTLSHLDFYSRKKT